MVFQGRRFLLADTIQDKKKLLNRVRRIRGQVTAIEKALEREEDCTAILQTLAACRGALNGLMAQLLEDQIRNHVLDRKPSTDSVESAEKLISIVKSYFK